MFTPPPPLLPSAAIPNFPPPRWIPKLNAYTRTALGKETGQNGGQHQSRVFQATDAESRVTGRDSDGDEHEEDEDVN